MNLYYLFSFFLGTIIGSFLNVVILRLGTGRGLNGRSACGSCAHKLSWYELVPVVSYLALRGRCRSCRSRISSQYAIVEFLTGAVFLLLSTKLSLPFVIFAWLVASLLIVVAVYDYRHMIIPDSMVYTLISMGIVYRVYEFVLKGYSSMWLWDTLSSILFWAFFASIWKCSDGRWMGYGDSKLAIVLGLFLGFLGGVVALMLSFWIGAIIGLVLLALSKSLKHKFTMKSEIPFGPFMILGMTLVYFSAPCAVWVTSLFTLY